MNKGGRAGGTKRRIPHGSWIGLQLPSRGLHDSIDCHILYVKNPNCTKPHKLITPDRNPVVPAKNCRISVGISQVGHSCLLTTMFLAHSPYLGYHGRWFLPQLLWRVHGWGGGGGRSCLEFRERVSYQFDNKLLEPPMVSFSISNFQFPPSSLLYICS